MIAWRVSAHAAERWADRFDPQLHDVTAARESLLKLCEGLSDTGERRQGKRLYTHPEYPWALFCVAHDLNSPYATLVTVLDSAINQPARTSLVSPGRKSKR